MDVNIFTEAPESWGVLRRLSVEVADRLDYVRISEEPGAINYFINYALYRDLPGISIGYFTHWEEGPPYHQRFVEVAKKVDYRFAQCGKTAKILERNLGLRASVVRPGTDLVKPIKFGVCGKVHPSGRKGEYLVKQMMDEGYDVVAWGKGWPCPIFSDSLEDRENFYVEIDYLVVTSLNEGGPLPLLEAVAMGVPVIAPDVGLCWEYPVIRYQKGSWLSLAAVLSKLSKSRTWDQWAKDHDRLFRSIASKVMVPEVTWVNAIDIQAVPLIEPVLEIEEDNEIILERGKDG